MSSAHQSRMYESTTSSFSRGRTCPFLLFVSLVILLLISVNTIQSGVNLHASFHSLASLQSFPLKHTNDSIPSPPLLSVETSQMYPPVDCHALLDTDHNNDLLNHTGTSISDPNQGALHARYTITDPPFWQALHIRDYDPTRWSVMEYGIYYEIQLGNAMVSILRNQKGDAPLHVVDVGSNIGWFTLLAVAAARKLQRPIVVDAFEPNPRNHVRLCESLFLNKWLDHAQVAVQIYPVGVTTHQDSGKVAKMPVDQSGTGRINALPVDKSMPVVEFPLVSLDAMAEELGWHDANDDDKYTSFLKVDVEGLELDVLEGASELLSSGRIRNMFCEGNLRSSTERKDFRSLVQLMVESGLEAYKVGGFRGPTEAVLSPYSTESRYAETLLEECKGLGETKLVQCNLWWRFRENPSSSVTAT